MLIAPRPGPVCRNGAGQIDETEFQALVTCMITLNRFGAELHALGAHAATDVTGFGLSGHALEMAAGADVQLVIEANAVPQLPRAAALCAAGFTCGGTKSNASFTARDTEFTGNLDQGLVGLLHDPQTSGGLLIAVPRDRVEDLRAAALAAGCLCAETIGEVAERPANGSLVVFRAG